MSMSSGALTIQTIQPIVKACFGRSMLLAWFTQQVCESSRRRLLASFRIAQTTLCLEAIKDRLRPRTVQHAPNRG